jgi:predicted dehydrogenase
MMSIGDSNIVLNTIKRPLRLGVVGGAPGSFIGPIHRSAAELDGRFRVVAGVLSSDHEKCITHGLAIGLDKNRAYANVEVMIAAEAARSDGIEALAVMTPNDSHFDSCHKALRAGLHVICDKPLTNDAEQARELVRLTNEMGSVFCLTHNYSGYPMVRQARAMVQNGIIGSIRMVHVEYFQGGMAIQHEDGVLTPKLKWKLDPQRGGPSLVMGDIGTHAHHLACFVNDSPVRAVFADIGTIIPGRKFDDYAAILWRFENGARGVCCVTQAAAGAENNITVRIYGEKGMLEWQHLKPNYLKHAVMGEPVRILARGDPYLLPSALRANRIMRGHPEGFRESFANLYADFAEAIIANSSGKVSDPLAMEFPTVMDGLRGVLFIKAALNSSAAGGSWVNCEVE